MPIALTAAYNPGDHDPGKTYPQAKIDSIEINVRRKIVAVILSFGDTVDDQFSDGVGAEKKRVLIRDDDSATPPGTEFTDLMATVTNDGENIYDAIKRIAYAKVQALESSLAGTVE